MLWQPVNLTEVCPAHTQLTACSHFGYLYLNLLVQLYGDSEDRRIQEKLHLEGSDDANVEVIKSYGRRIARDFEGRRNIRDDTIRVKKSFLSYDKLLALAANYRHEEKRSATLPDYDADGYELYRGGFGGRQNNDKKRFHTHSNDDLERFGHNDRKPRRNQDDELQDKERGRGEYDFVVVGAGSAGCVVASRLSEVREWKVLLLEAGPEQPDVTLVPSLSTALLGSNIDWSYKTMPDGKSCLARPGGRCDWPRGKTMGGSSSINSLAYIRGNRYDYDSWAAMGNEGWSYKDVLPFFKKSENNLDVEGLDNKYHGTDGPQYVSRYPFIDDPSIMLTEAFNEGGLPINDYNGAHQMGTMQAQAVSKDGKRVSTNNAFIQPIRYKRKNLTVKPDAEVVKILIDKNMKAFGVKYVRDGKLYVAYAKKDVIVSAGAINSPKLLLLSGIGPKEQLQRLHIDVIQDLPVGENLHDHVTFNGMAIALPNRTATTVDKDEILAQVKAYKAMEPKRGPLSGNGPVNSVSFLKTDPHLPAPDIQYQVDCVNWQEYIREPDAYERIATLPTAFYNSVIPRTMNVAPKSRGKLILNTTDPHAAPLLYANYYGDPSDMIPLIKGVRFLISLENTKAFKSRGAQFIKIPLEACKHYTWGTDEYIECLARAYTSTPFHPVGTCKMGPKWDKTAVVDPRLRVYGVSGLRVIDASIMPIVPRGNTNAPAILVGERGVQLVKEDWLHNYYEH